MKLEPIYNRCTTVSTAMKVCHLKAILEDLSDEMPVVIPARVDENYNILTNCVAVGTAGVLSSPYEAIKVLCLNTMHDQNDKISKQVDSITIRCEKVLF